MELEDRVAGLISGPFGTLRNRRMSGWLAFYGTERPRATLIASVLCCCLIGKQGWTKQMQGRPSTTSRSQARARVHRSTPGSVALVIQVSVLLLWSSTLTAAPHRKASLKFVTSYACRQVSSGYRVQFFRKVSLPSQNVQAALTAHLLTSSPATSRAGARAPQCGLQWQHQHVGKAGSGPITRLLHREGLRNWERGRSLELPSPWVSPRPLLLPFQPHLFYM